MSQKNTFISNTKSSTSKKLQLSKRSNKNSDCSKVIPKASNKITSKYLYMLMYNNLKKYTTNKKKYNKFIITSIIFDHRIHKVAVFKNNLLWDESSEFLKRFYKKKESKERIPKISEYYEKYTLFPPVYFGLEGLIVVIMNKWTKKKKNYLEYVEDHEEERKKKTVKESFEPLINSSSLNNIDNSKSIISKKTLDLTKFENESKKNLNNKNVINPPSNKKNNIIKIDKIENISLSDIMDDLSSNYSVIINEENKKKSKNIHNIKRELKTKKIYKNNIILDKTGNNAKLLNSNNKIEFNINNSSKKINLKNEECSPKEYVKISLNKKNNKYIIKNTNPKILFRNGVPNMPTHSVKNSQKRILNTDNIKKSKLYSKNKNKGTIRVNTIANYVQENNKAENNNEPSQNKEKENGLPLKKYDFNFIINNTNKNLTLANKKHNTATINNNLGVKNSTEKIQNRIIRNKNTILKRKNYVQIKKEPFLSINNLSNSLSKYKQSTYRNQTSTHNYFKEGTTNNPSTSKTNAPKIKMEIINSKKIKNNCNTKFYLEDPFIYKLSQLSKKKIVSVTAANSLSQIKNFSINGFNSITGNSSIKYNNSKNKLKIANKKNLVLGKLATKDSLIYNKKRKISGNNSMRNNSANTSIITKKNDNSLNLNISNKKVNNWKNSNKKNNSKNINLNLNLNIHFNIDLENKNKRRKILFNNTIINQLQNKTNKNMNCSYNNKSKEKDFNYQYPLTSRESNNNLKDLLDINKTEHKFSKKVK